MNKYFVIILFIGFFITIRGYARPITYPGGWTFFINSGNKVYNLGINYTPWINASLGYNFEYWENKEMLLNSLQLNYLLKRWNNKNSQSNMYLVSGIGFSQKIDSINLSTYGGMSFDWETRTYYISYKNRYMNTINSSNYFKQSIRLGWAPYEGQYGDVHTWFMVKFEHDPNSEYTYTVTPLLRFFKGNNLLEIGINNKREILFNYVFLF